MTTYALTDFLPSSNPLNSLSRQLMDTTDFLHTFFIFLWSNLTFMILSPFFLHPILQIQSLAIWPYLLLAFLVAIEGPLATLAAAVASSTGYLDPRFVFLSASCGNLSADILWYSLGYAGKIDFLTRYGGWLGLKQDLILKLKQDINEHVGKFLFVAKLTLGLVVPTLIAAGLARVPWRRWIGLLFLAEGIWTGSLVLAGYYYGQYILHIEAGLQWISIIATAIVGIVLVVYLLRRRSQRDNQ